ncbi:MAG: SDR family oxidoreductase [Deltaproteobacteria bacterium]|nr:MAG: SDR family oxidoreductase [Deltaproteobacteria bacterium]
MDLSLEGKRAFVCGSSRGIGKAAAVELASLGATVTLVARDEARLAAVREELPRPFGQSHDFLAVDFGTPERLHEAVSALLAGKRVYEILVNNTGGPPPGPITEAPPEAFLDAFTKHLVCNQILVQALLPGMKGAGYGRIVNIISTSVKAPIPGLGVSNTIRGAVANWAKTLAGEVAPFGITVNNVLPGFTETERLSALIEARAQQRGCNPETVVAEMKSQVPAGRFADPSEVAHAIAFLASPAAAYLTGINLPVDGGRLGCL